MLKVEIQKAFERKQKQVAVLLDPGKLNDERLVDIVAKADVSGVDYFFVGGSLVSETADNTIARIRKTSNLPIILFPGSVMQISKEADAILFLSLISGRNPDYLIGHHVIAAPILKNSKLQILPTGYILIESGSTTSVEYMSNTRSIPQSKHDIIVATAVAGQMLGLKQLYVDAGSGAEKIIHPDIVKKIKQNTSIPLIVGGGIRSKTDAIQLFEAGADIVVIGSLVEQQTDEILPIVEAGKIFN